MDGVETVADIVQRSGLTKTELCRRAEMGRAQLDRYLNGKASPNLTQMGRLLAAAGLRARVSLEPAAQPMNPRLIGVLGLGSLLPRADGRVDLIDLSDVWSGARRAANERAS